MSTDNFAIERKSFSEKFKAFRKANKLTLQQMAAKLGVSNGFLSEVENNKKMPGGDVLISLKRNYDISLDYLLSDGPTAKFAAELECTYAPESLPPEELDLLKRFRNLDKRHQINILEMMAGYEALSEGSVGIETAESGSAGIVSKMRSNG